MSEEAGNSLAGQEEGTGEGAVSQRSRAGINSREQSVRPAGGTRPAWAQQVGGLGVMWGAGQAQPHALRVR